MKFLSSEKLNPLENLNFFPGPGHYDVTSLNKLKSSNPNKRQKHTAKPPFGQSEDRFFGSKKEVLNTGPGYYFGQLDWQSKNARKEPKAQFCPNPRKIITIPSIPSSTHAMGYVEREDGYLIPLNASVVKDHQDIGPGMYNPDDTLTKKKVQGFSLARIKSPRFTADKPDPASSTLDQDPFDEPKKEILREVPQKVKPRERLPKPEVFKEQDAALDPGYYYNERIASSFKVQNKPLEFQYFGSTAKRFQNSNQSILPGPGFYNLVSSTSPNGFYQTPNIEPFSKGDTRFKGSPQDELPGPGAYDVNSTITPREVFTPTGGFQSAFGSGLTRFGPSKESLASQPGPGSYNPKPISKKNKKRKARRGISSFYSNTAPGNSVTPKEPQFGTEFEQKGRAKGAVIVKHEMPTNKGSAVFQSNAERFESKKENRSLTPGPGSYIANPGKGFVKRSFSTAKTSFAFSSRVPDEGKSNNYKQSLGPGIYDYEVDIIKPKINYAPKINPISPFVGTMMIPK